MSTHALSVDQMIACMLEYARVEAYDSGEARVTIALNTKNKDVTAILHPCGVGGRPLQKLDQAVTSLYDQLVSNEVTKFNRAKEALHRLGSSVRVSEDPR